VIGCLGDIRSQSGAAHGVNIPAWNRARVGDPNTLSRMQVARASQRNVVNVAQHGGMCGVMVTATATNDPRNTAEMKTV